MGRLHFVGSMVDMKDIESCFFDRIFGNHNIGHLGKHGVVFAMTKFHKVLKSDWVTI